MASAAAEVATLYADHGEWLRSWLGRRTRCPHRAVDLVHDTFCRLLEQQDAAVTPRDPRSYLATVARRLLIDDARRRKLELAYLAACPAEIVDSLTPERVLAAVDMLEEVLRLMAGMTDTVRAAFLLRRLGEMTYADIGERLGISERTAKRHVARAYADCYTLAYSD
ncbi:sigma-70 family RNA polymerase sigma factor [Caulobacter mirabilis]|uniref:RNA polymerase subunit sigma-70 n=1 Tax=Caulobacter mirabilis TaxID=69666 RepID=A0A2D2B303_9CAUL|nr:sigma-70 family RNA polymerase sigma factor [Caulobacter mirabilis]ATQ44623.1 RNA polymerase subunit sigma-70 [Caulobacter mirabilis]